MKHTNIIIGALLSCGLAALGCNDGLFTDSETRIHALEIDLRSLHSAAFSAADPCPWVLAETVLLTDGQAPLRIPIQLGDTGATFNQIEVKAGQEIRVEIRSQNNHLLSEGITRITQANIDQGQLRIQPLKLLPALEVCQATAVADHQTWGEFALGNVGADGLMWNVTAIDAPCQGMPCIQSFRGAQRSISTNTAISLSILSTSAAEGQTYDVIVSSLYPNGSDEVPVSLHVNPCVDFDTLLVDTSFEAGLADPILLENQTRVFSDFFYIAPNISEPFGFIDIIDATIVSFGTDKAVRFGNATLLLQFPVSTPILYVKYSFWNQFVQPNAINFSVNGESIYIGEDFTDAMPTPPGIRLEVDAVNSRGSVILRSDGPPIESLFVGGVELLLDSVCFGETEPTPPPSL